MSRYGGITGSKKISEDYQNINTAFDKVEADVDAKAAIVNTHIANQSIHVTQADHNKLDGIEAGAEANQNAFSRVNGMNAELPTDEFTIVGDVGIDVTQNPNDKSIHLTVTGESAPGPHAATHLSGGSDPIPTATPTTSGLMPPESFQAIEDNTAAVADVTAQLAEIAYNVKAFGAIGDGVVDDTVSIQAAINAASEAGGGTVYFPEPVNVYMVSTLTIPSNIVITAAHKGVTVKQIDGSTGSVFRINPGAKDILIHTLTVDATSTGNVGEFGIGVSTGSSSRIVIENVTVINASIDGIHIDDNNSDVKIINNTCLNSARMGIGLNGTVTNILVHGNVCTGGGEGINIIGTGNGVIISDNITQNTAGDGITGYGPNHNDITIIGNICRDIGNNGIHIAGTNIVIANNTFKNCVNRCIYYASSPLGDGTDLLISGNSCIGTTSLHAIQILQCSRFTITGNKIKSANGRSISIEKCSIGTLVGNQISDGNGDNIRIDGSTYIAISGNHIRGGSNGIYLVDNGTLYSHYNNITGNILTGGTGRGVWITGSADYNLVSDNSITSFAIANINNVSSGVNNIINGGLGYSKAGRFIGNGNGSATTFTFPHGLAAAPPYVFVTATSTAARGDFSAVADATNITVTFAVAPVSGSNNVVLTWEARVFV